MSSLKAAAALGALFLAAVLQTTLISHLAGAGSRPDLLLALVAGIGLVAGPQAGGAAGCCAGAIADLLTGRLLGLGLLSRGTAGVVSGLLAGRLFQENALVPFVVGAAVSLIDQLLYIGGVRAFGVVIPFGESLTRVIFPGMWYNGLLTALCFPLIYRVNRRLTYTE